MTMNDINEEIDFCYQKRWLTDLTTFWNIIFDLSPKSKLHKPTYDYLLNTLDLQIVFRLVFYLYPE
jgi:hypothetical protein